jgi:hypothetical protein
MAIKNNYPLLSKKLLLTAIIAICGFTAKAQYYTFQQFYHDVLSKIKLDSLGYYSTATAGSPLFSPSANSLYSYDNQDYGTGKNRNLKLYNGINNVKDTTVLYGNGYPIGFDFIIDQDTLDRFALSTTGIIQLGKGIFPIYRDTAPALFFTDNSHPRKDIICPVCYNYNEYNQLGVSNLGYGKVMGYPGRRILPINFDWADTLNSVTGGYFTENTTSVELFEGLNGFLTKFITIANGTAVHKVATGILGSSPASTMLRKVIDGRNIWGTSELSIGDTLADLNDLTGPGNTNENGRPYILYHLYYPSTIYTAPACQQVFCISGLQYDSSYISTNADNYYYKFLTEATNIPRNPIIGWTGGNPFDTTYRYDVYLDTDNPPTQKLDSNLTGLSIALPTLAANTRYYYKVVAKNSSGNTSQCAASWFETGNNTIPCGDASFSQQDSAGYLYNPSLESSSQGYVNSVQLQDINYVATNSFLKSVSQFPQQAPFTTSLRAGQTYAIKIGQTPANYFTKGILIGIDFDRNNLIDYIQPAPGFSVADSLDVVALDYTGFDSIHIPATVTPGNTFLSLSYLGSNLGHCYGDKIFPVTILPRLGCDSFTINPVINEVSCYGDSTGTIALNIRGGSQPYNITWTDNANVHDTTRVLPKGQYSAQIIDATGCHLATDLMVVEQPALLSIDTVVTQPLGNTLGSITANVNGGTPPYIYQWNTGATTSSINNLAAGNYSVSVTDSNGCVTTLNDIQIQVASPVSCNSFTINPVVNEVTCYGTSTGSIALNIQGGSQPYNITWADNTSTHDAIRNLLPDGQYSAQVTDAVDCHLATGLMEIKQSDPLSIDTVVTQPSVTALGSIQINVSGGTAPYTYQWNNGAATSLVNSLSAGIYSVSVTDSSGCIATLNNIQIQALAQTSLGIQPNPASGTFTITGLAADSKHTIIILNTLGQIMLEYKNTNKQSFDISTLVAGVYMVGIDNNGPQYLRVVKQ